MPFEAAPDTLPRLHFYISLAQVEALAQHVKRLRAAGWHLHNARERAALDGEALAASLAREEAARKEVSRGRGTHAGMRAAGDGLGRAACRPWLLLLLQAEGGPSMQARLPAAAAPCAWATWFAHMVCTPASWASAAGPRGT